ncbi:aliphatic sulfonate ABC transporter substrate-binding protein [Pseudomonas typographi]|uniref:Aliphatic sulfonate ABC transporter substrate-binding protein n=1 Tax=Pseudomonas typographi TaxID=2715964 RepID=A0ABR7Z308_9PSED|nr:aliphatic sulfonate ABC transporter substrate-binding protein [Pseudomonas typographi]MBD1550259.1 aliphatic sulfonate ABC transporter substrate-binding protein [Pseudomonas typographi]MBD1585974.1 aliphatic sulfonate ABC transporter substrate-binding protein [Pseudomonas typographi]MBD1599661.1 aliphatic sulfonate ABC transporter substrate-binding protein [Pseudomonas typographi]
MDNGNNKRLNALSRRNVIKAGIGLAAAWQLGSVHAAEASTLRIGYQKFNTLNILKGTGLFEKALQPHGIQVEWREFPGGSQLVEALYTGAIDVGHASDAVSVFQQATGKNLNYLAAESPYPGGIGLLVKEDSQITQVAHLKGRRVGVGKGYNIQYALIRALQSHGLAYSDIEPVYIVTASDAVAAYQAGSIDAVGLWDPFLAGAQLATPSRLLFDGTGLSNNRTFHLARPEAIEPHRQALALLFETLKQTNQWAEQNPDKVVALLAPQLGIDPNILDLATKRRRYGIVPLSAAIAEEQQRMADVFLELKLIPNKIDVQTLFSTAVVV